MMCTRCCYDIGVTTTTCRLCGAKVPRVRATFVAVLSLVLGLGMGTAVIAVL